MLSLGALVMLYYCCFCCSFTTGFCHYDFNIGVWRYGPTKFELPLSCYYILATFPLLLGYFNVILILFSYRFIASIFLLL